ncbi:hypothetical protein Bca52824_008334 [Brassica carinata]|uniref:Uncharacterized protein n=1 Tax=Brassica carinata TaxID=52824 RepID=A0A8X7W927_BRACI|nr:hypothetical protein Bca52824_008334 [Brassica carinata]
MWTGKPGKSESLRILQVVVSATNTKDRKTVTFLLDLSYLINLPVLSTFRTAAKNCLLWNLMLVSVKYIYQIFMLINVQIISETKRLPLSFRNQGYQSRHQRCKDHRFSYRNATLTTFHTRAPTLVQTDEHTSP